MLLLAMVGTLLINFANSVGSYITYISLSVLGIGMSGLLTASLFLVNEFAVPEHRGFITGMQTFFGVVGITFQTLIGALLYEYVNRSGPFTYFGCTCFVAIILTCFVYWHAQKVKLDRLLHTDKSLQASEDILPVEATNSA